MLNGDDKDWIPYKINSFTGSIANLGLRNTGDNTNTEANIDNYLPKFKGYGDK